MTESTQTTPTEHPAPRPPRRLHRHPEDRVLAGVSGGLGAYLGVDPVVVRVGFVVASFFWLLGVVAYVALWILVPEAESAEAVAPAGPAVSWPPASWIGIGLVALGAILLFNVTFWPLALVAIGIVLLVKGAQDDTPAAVPPATGSATAPLPVAPAAGSPPTAMEPPAPPKAPKPRRPRSGLGQATVGLALAAAGVLALLDASGVLAPSPAHYVATLLTVVGGGLLVGAWWGRARWLIAVGLVLLPVLFVAAVFPRIPSGPIGEMIFRATEATPIQPSYELGAGSFLLDLREADFSGEPVVTAVSLGMGEIVVRVPDDVAVTVSARVGVGEVVVGDVRREGARIDLRHTLPGDRGELHLDIDAGFGSVRVVRESPDW